jgi:UDP-glucose 4-epimerase
MKSHKNVLVTGVAGLLGSHFAEYLIANNYNVVGIDNLTGGYRENVPKGVKFYKADLCDNKSVSSIVRDNNIDFIYHFAAYAAVGLSPFIRRFNYNNNIIASVNLINAAIKFEVEKFVFASSMDVYGEQTPPFLEDLTPSPMDPYGIAKYAIEMDLANAWRQFGLRYTIIRPHNVIGPRQNIWDRYRNVAGIWIRKAMAEEPLTIYGDGEQRRAFSDVKFYMEPFLKLILNNNTDQQIINIGADEDVSINDLAAIVQDVAHSKTGIRPAKVYLEPRDEVKLMWCNHDKAKELLGFVDNTDLYALVDETWEWAKNINPKPIKTMDYELEKGMYGYWKTK